MQTAGRFDEEPPLRPSGPGQGRLAPDDRRLFLGTEPTAEDVAVVQAADPVLEILPERGRPGLLAPQQVADLGRIAQPPGPAAQDVERLRVEAFSKLGKGRDEGGAFPVPNLMEAGEHGEDVLRAARYDRAEVAAQARDLQVHQRLGHASAAARPRPAQTAAQEELLGTRLRDRLEPFLEKQETHVQVAAPARGAGEIANDPERLADPPAVRLAGQERKGHSQPASRHPHLMDRLLIARQALGEVLEYRPDTVPEER